MKFTTGMIAVAAWLLGPPPAIAGDILFGAFHYGEINLRLPQSVLHLENILGSAENFEPMADYNPDSRLRQLGRPVGRLDVLYSDDGVKHLHRSAGIGPVPADELPLHCHRPRVWASKPEMPVSNREAWGR